MCCLLVGCFSMLLIGWVVQCVVDWLGGSVCC